MKDYGSSTYGDRIAEVYDEWHAGLDPTPAVETLAGLAGSGPVLELAIGTGRIALPLARRGVDVYGIDASEAMVAKLREKPGGERIPVTIGDFADVGVDGSFAVVFVAFNTFFALLTQEEQVRCFTNVAARLAEGGSFVLEVFVPDLARFDRSQRVSVTEVELDRIKLEVSRHDAVAQTVASQHVAVSDAGLQLHPVSLRYAWPAELDLMGRLAGLRLVERWEGWSGEPFTSASKQHVSVYRRS